MLNDTFLITVVFIVLSTVVAAFIRRKTRDKCLKNFADSPVTLEQTACPTTHGKLYVENTGLEFVYPAAKLNENSLTETTLLLYKSEYPKITALIRYHDQLTEEQKKQRLRDLEKTYHPKLMCRLKRKTINIFKTIRDSIGEVINILISKVKSTTPAGTVLTSQDKYVSNIKSELISVAGTSFEPLLEKYIGRKVLLELLKDKQAFEYCGILKEYTAAFIEIMDVDYKTEQNQTPRKADLVVPRICGIIRHLAE